MDVTHRTQLPASPVSAQTPRLAAEGDRILQCAAPKTETEHRSTMTSADAPKVGSSTLHNEATSMDNVRRNNTVVEIISIFAFLQALPRRISTSTPASCCNCPQTGSPPAIDWRQGKQAPAHCHEPAHRLLPSSAELRNVYMKAASPLSSHLPPERSLTYIPYLLHCSSYIPVTSVSNYPSSLIPGTLNSPF